MPIYTVKVKWGKELFNGIELNTNEEAIVFKAQLFALTGVKVERQKVMFKGKVIPDQWPESLALKDGITILLMGTADELPKMPSAAEKPLFMEDMTDTELAAAFELPAGLSNLGNTCYLNATVQCLRTVPELREALTRFDGGLALAGQIEPAQTLTAALRDLYQNMEKNTTVAPIILVQVLHLAFPRFAEKGERGVYIQQDANEVWTELMRMLQQKLKSEESKDREGKTFSLIEKYFTGAFDVQLQCIDNKEESVTHSVEHFNQLSCFISQDVKYLQSGLKSRLNETLTKLSPSLNCDAQYAKTSKISRLPAYLSIQFVRFFYKEKDAINAKILKDIKFTLTLDTFELCNDELQEKLMPMRTLFKKFDDFKLEESRKDKISGDDAVKKPKQSDKREDTTGEKYRYPYSFEDDIGSNNSGLYDLQAVLTHKGRSSSSGHYVAWIKRKEDQWFKMDDDDITTVTPDDILKLSGGGDWHVAYVLLYGPRIHEVDEKPMEQN